MGEGSEVVGNRPKRILMIGEAGQEEWPKGGFLLLALNEVP